MSCELVCSPTYEQWKEEQITPPVPPSTFVFYEQYLTVDGISYNYGEQDTNIKFNFSEEETSRQIHFENHSPQNILVYWMTSAGSYSYQYLLPNDGSWTKWVDITPRENGLPFVYGVRLDKNVNFYARPFVKSLDNIIDFGEVEYDTDKVSKIFDDHYAVWHIVDPHDRFAKELQNTYDKAKDRLDLYYKSIKDFNPVSKTVMDVEYGQRRNRSDSFDYPVGGEDTSPTNTQDNIEDAKKDTTTVSRNDDPFGVLVKMGKMATFYDMFIDTFKDLFTEFEAMTW